MNHATNDKSLRIFDLKLVFYPVALFLICIIIIVPNAIGGEPISKNGSASASVTALVISMDQMAEIGPGDTTLIYSKNEPSRYLIDTVARFDKLYITLICE